MSDGDERKEPQDAVYYFRCGKCGSEVFWSEIRPSVQRAARVFKWVRAGCPNEACDNHLTLSDPDRMYTRDEARSLFEDLKNKGAKAYWV